jgi:signal transduction histidine kinase
MTTPRSPADAAVAPTEANSPRAASFIEFDDLTVTPKLRFLATGVRWASTALGAGISLWRDPNDKAAWACAVALVAFALWQTIQPPALDVLDTNLRFMVAIELALTAAVTLLTGSFESPYVLTPMVPLMLAGYAWAARRILVVAYFGLAVVGLLGITQRASPEASRSAVLLGIVFLLCAVLGAFTRRLIEESTARHSATLDQVTKMTRANELLVALHGLAQTLPSSLDLTEVTESLRLRLRETFGFTALTVFVRDDLAGVWRIAVAEGVRATEAIPTSGLAAPLANAARSTAHHGTMTTLVHDHLVENTRGHSPMARSGLYACLQARGKVVGLVAIEHRDPNYYDREHLDLLASIAGAVALSLDNALWFSRLRLFGAESERARIARDLHDRIAQSLAYVAFELERLAESGRAPSQSELGDLRDVVRSVVTELRDTLYELRAAVSTSEDLVSVAERYLERYRKRTATEVDFEHHVVQRPAVAIEQELWRIVQEALENAAKHARADRARIAYTARKGHIELVISDDGRGFEAHGHSGDHYGLVGMRERADAIGAVLHIESRPGRGTTIRVTLEVPT